MLARSGVVVISEKASQEARGKPGMEGAGAVSLLSIKRKQ